MKMPNSMGKDYNNAMNDGYEIKHLDARGATMVMGMMN